MTELHGHQEIEPYWILMSQCPHNSSHVLVAFLCTWFNLIFLTVYGSKHVWILESKKAGFVSITILLIPDSYLYEMKYSCYQNYK